MKKQDRIPVRPLGPETANGYPRRLREGFFARYFSGDAILDIGFRGGNPDAQPITEKAIGVELDYPGYDGTYLPFPDGSQDTVFASHVLEHIEDYHASLADWYRVLRVGGFLVLVVPHQYLYERKAFLPSRFNGDHKRFYTPRSLLAEVEESLPLAAYRIRSLRDIDDGFNYATQPEDAPEGAYEIELVVEKIQCPRYVTALTGLKASEKIVEAYADLLADLIRFMEGKEEASANRARGALMALPLPPFQRLRRYFSPGDERAKATSVLKTLLAGYAFDEKFYLASNADVAEGANPQQKSAGLDHYVNHGYFEGRRALRGTSLFD